MPRCKEANYVQAQVIPIQFEHACQRSSKIHPHVVIDFSPPCLGLRPVCRSPGALFRDGNHWAVFSLEIHCAQTTHLQLARNFQLDARTETEKPGFLRNKKVWA
jgi:hypothetical protein